MRCVYVRCHSDTGEVLSQMGAGDFFGEIGILNLDGGVNKYVICVRFKEVFTFYYFKIKKNTF